MKFIIITAAALLLISSATVHAEEIAEVPPPTSTEPATTTTTTTTMTTLYPQVVTQSPEILNEEANHTAAIPPVIYMPLLTVETTSSAPSEQPPAENPPLLKLCIDFLHDPDTCVQLYTLCRDENYLRLTWEVTNHIFFQRPFGIVLFILWTIMLCILNFAILFVCTLLKPLRSLLLTKIVSDLRRRYYFTNEASELRVVDTKPGPTNSKK